MKPKIDNKEFHTEVMMAQETGAPTHRLLDIFELLVTRYANFGEWNKSKYDDHRLHMIEAAFEELSTNSWKHFRPKDSTSAYSGECFKYMATIAFCEFRKLTKHIPWTGRTILDELKQNKYRIE